MAFDPVTAALNVGSQIIDKIFPDKEAANKAKVELLRLQQDGELRHLEVQMSALVAEAKSSDPWTSRARPSFLYVIYILILASIPMGVLSVFDPNAATQIAAGMAAWLGSIPGELWTVFGIGYTGYTVSRSVWDKQAADRLIGKANGRG